MQRLLKRVALLAVAGMLQACASAPDVMQYFPDGEAPGKGVVWPAAPATARLEYAGLLIGDRNFTRVEGAKEGAGVRFLRWVAGLGDGRPAVRELIRPQSGVVDNSGRILITDAGLQAVVVFDEVNARLSIWTEAGSGSTFKSPVGIGTRMNGEILVADAELAKITILAADGTPIQEFGNDILQRPTGLAVDPVTGYTYVSDTAAHNIKVFDAEGILTMTLGRRGTGPGEFNGPTHLCFDRGILYVTDTFNTRVQVLTPDGQPIAELGKQGLYVGNLVRPKGVTTDSDGNVYVVESYFDHLLVFDRDGNLLLPIGGAGQDIGQFFLPSGAWSDSTNRIFVADMFNGRVIILRYLGG